jgi:capsular polysaccharide biosynthesis protein
MSARIAAVIALFLSACRPPDPATLTLQVTPAPSHASETNTSLIAAQRDILTSATVLWSVAETLRLHQRWGLSDDHTAAKLRGMISVRTGSAPNVVLVQVYASDRAFAVQLANTLGDFYAQHDCRDRAHPLGEYCVTILQRAD